MSGQTQPRLIWTELLSFKRFAQGEQGKPPKTFQLTSVSDKSFGIQMAEGQTKLTMKLSRAEALDLAHGILANAKY